MRRAARPHKAGTGPHGEVPRLHRQAGVTALELVVVVAIIGVTMGLTIPAFSRLMQSNSLKDASEKFAGHFRLARMMAVSKDVPHIVTWDVSNGTYQVVRDVNGNDAPDNGEPFDGPFALPGNILLANPGFSADQVTFLRDGSASEAGTLVLSNARGHSVDLTVLVATGHVRLD
jgi:Tfp pilus assembly protein FimT